MKASLEQALGVCDGCLADSDSFVRIVTAHLRACAPEAILPIGRAADDYVSGVHDSYMGAYKQACEVLESGRATLGPVAYSAAWRAVVEKALRAFML